MRDLTLTTNQFNPEGYWTNAIGKLVFKPTVDDLALFDQNGYDLTDLEKEFAGANESTPKPHRSHRVALKQDWFTQEEKTEGAVLNHSLLFERKGYREGALAQLRYWATDLPRVHQLCAIRPKWGLDFSMDWVDREGNAFEILHWEYDCFDYAEAAEIKELVQPKLNSIDWDDAAQQLLKRKDEWHGLDFFAQSDWKCNYFRLVKERFKMVIWK
jgi:hypothetical protein